MNQYSVAIIGPAKSEGFTKELYTKMIKKAECIITETLKLQWPSVKLVSGGSSWCDHVAVELYKKHRCFLKLCLPCEWSDDKFFDNKFYDWKINPGRTLNIYHINFSKTIGKNTLKELGEVMKDKNVEVQIFQGFHKRNLEIARAQYCIAFSWTPLDDTARGGTAYTWKNFKGSKKIFVDLNKL